MYKFIFIIITFFSLNLIIGCDTNYSIKSQDSISYKDATKELVNLSLLFQKRDKPIDLFIVGLAALEPFSVTGECNREILYDKVEFNNCKELILLYFSVNPPIESPGLLAVDIFRNLCKVKKVYFLEKGNFDGEINFCGMR